MRDNQGRSLFHQCVNRLLNLRFGERVDARSGLIENYQWWISQNHSGYRQTLLLAHTQPNASLSDTRIHFVRKIRDESPSARSL